MGMDVKTAILLVPVLVFLAGAAVWVWTNKL